ncbi:GNAT family N-acetyltransferase [Candidatus Gottesmanbacteria bacterium]|nr:GNAT family N-acetyltransferase [Candidatus Gottesmanbacteria bacterium]
MDDLRFITSEGDPKPEDKKVLTEGLLAHHMSKGHPRKSKVFSIFLKNQNDKVFGGIIVSLLWNGMEIQSLWVDESVRKQGWGRKLLEAVETEAIKRGCTIVYTNTFSWQAGDFYTKLGYATYGKLDGFPENNSLIYYRKNLVS